MNRRQLLLRGALLAALAPVVRAAGGGSTGAGGAGEAAPPQIAVHDPALRRSREFAAALQDRGARVLALEPDAMAAWHDQLRAACVASPATRVVGLTTRTDFMVLRDLARGVGLAPLALHDADARDAAAGDPRRRATLVAWVLAPRVAVA
ncbi:MAG TPA: hypothetical protein VKO83_14630 [Steroidobacteraceae bacterium]|nr:hypothetical protein [Steroidobacteraceae bacterium]